MEIKLRGNCGWHFECNGKCKEQLWCDFIIKLEKRYCLVLPENMKDEILEYFINK